MNQAFAAFWENFILSFVLVPFYLPQSYGAENMSLSKCGAVRDEEVPTLEESRPV